MPKNKKFEVQQVGNFRRKSKFLETIDTGLEKIQFLVFSLRDLDRVQGEHFENWEENQILAKALNRIHGFCRMTLKQAINEKLIKIYGKGMPKNSKYCHPNHVHDDVQWASIRIQGKERIIGYVEHNFIFQIVFMDKEHLFYPSEKKHT